MALLPPQLVSNSVARAKTPAYFTCQSHGPKTVVKSGPHLMEGSADGVRTRSLGRKGLEATTDRRPARTRSLSPPPPSESPGKARPVSGRRKGGTRVGAGVKAEPEAELASTSPSIPPVTEDLGPPSLRPMSSDRSSSSWPARPRTTVHGVIAAMCAVI